jgi:photosystem II PsbY protein
MAHCCKCPGWGRSGAGGASNLFTIPLADFFDAMDLRLLLVVAPILLAASWAVLHIGRAAVGQLQLFIKRAQA